MAPNGLRRPMPSNSDANDFARSVAADAMSEPLSAKLEAALPTFVATDEETSPA